MDEPLKGVKLSREEVLQILEEARKKGERPNLSGADLSNVNLNKVDLRETNLLVAELKGAELRWADLSGSDLSGANLYRADLISAKLTKANLNNTCFIGALLATADLTGVELGLALLSGAYLNGTKLIDANLFGATLIDSNLTGADLEGAKLTEADFTEANLNGANLTGADLNHTNLSGANLSGANLNGAYVGYTIFGDIDLRDVKGLDTIEHQGPSEISISTFYKSKGSIPEVFLRGCGVPDNFIKYVRSLTGQAFEYYSCFISYSSKDQEVAERLHANLQAKGVRCWFAPEDLKIGDKTRVAIDESIRVHDKLLLILSENSVKSEWVEHEVEHALDLERTRKKLVLFPVRLDDSVMESTTGWAGNIRRQRNIGDFTKWKDHDAYQKSFARLLRDLKAENNEL